MTTRLEVINNALIATGNEPRSVEFDDSDEWATAFSLYERAVRYLLAMHPWGFAETTQVLPAADSAVPDYDYGYTLPGDRLLLRAVYYCGAPFSDYRVVGNIVCAPYDGKIEAVYVREPPGEWPPLFVEALTMRVEAGLLAAFNEDVTGARAREMAADALFQNARTKSDQESGRRAWYRSRVMTRRLTGGRL